MCQEEENNKGKKSAKCRIGFKKNEKAQRRQEEWMRVKKEIKLTKGFLKRLNKIVFQLLLIILQVYELLNVEIIVFKGFYLKLNVSKKC